MRERLVVAFVGLTVLVVVAFAVTTTYSTAAVVQVHQVRKLEHSALLVARAVEERRRGSAPVTAEFLESLLDIAQRIEYAGPGGDTVTVQSSDFDPDTRDDDLVHTEPVAGGGSVTLTRAGALVDQRVDEAVLPMVLVALGLVLVAGVLGVVAARKLARPFDELAGFAALFGRGRFDAPIPHYSVPEADAIGAAMRQAGVELDDRIRREREFAANASHQLRTPITALRLELEDLILWPETPPAVAAELQQSIREVDRLGATVIDLLDLARDRRLNGLAEVDLATLTAEAVARWEPLAARVGRSITRHDPGKVRARIAPGPVSQVLDVLVENALKHGRGTIDVRVAEGHNLVQVQVRDEGPRPTDATMFRRHVNGLHSDGEGIGLAVATEIAEAMGGQLRLEQDPCTTFSLVVPQQHGSPG